METVVNYQPVKHTVFWEAQRGIIRYMGAVEPLGIIALCDEIKLLVEYYKYKRITLEIDSPGGEVRSLHYYLDKLHMWRKKGIKIETMALTQCSSAGAFMLSMGDLGCRMAMPRSSLLYHNVRIYGDGQQPLTSNRLGNLKTALTQTDAEMMMELLRHLYSAVEQKYFDAIEGLICRLPYIEDSIVANKDMNMFMLLKDNKLNRLLKALPKNASSDVYRNDLYRQLCERLRDRGKGLEDVKSIEGLDKHLKALDAEAKEGLILTWLFARFEYYQALFEEDSSIRPEIAISEGLIDRIGVEYEC